MHVFYVIKRASLHVTVTFDMMLIELNSSYFFLHVHKASGDSVLGELRDVNASEAPYVFSCEGCLKQALANPDIFPLTPRLLTFVRHPLNRIISHYNMESSHSQRKNSKYSFDDFLAEHEGRNWKNFMTNKLKEGDGRFDNRAAQHHEYWFTGVTEYFAASMCILFHKMGIPDKEGKCECSNRGSEGKDSSSFVHRDHGVHNYPHEISKANLTEKTIEYILGNNKDDISLFYSTLVHLKEEADSIQRATGIDLLCEVDRHSLVEALRQSHHDHDHGGELGSMVNDGGSSSQSSSSSSSSNSFVFKNNNADQARSVTRKAADDDDDDDDNDDDNDDDDDDDDDNSRVVVEKKKKSPPLKLKRGKDDDIKQENTNNNKNKKNHGLKGK